MNVHFAFGKTGLELRLPDRYSYKLLEARSASALPDWREALITALDAPIAGPPLQELAAGKRSAAISVCDITRPAPNRLVLPPVLERLERAGIARDAGTIVIATGRPTPATDAEHREIFEPGSTGKNHIAKSDSRESA